MRNFIYILLILSGFVFNEVIAQSSKISEFNIEATKFSVDNLGYFYFVNGSSLIKTDGNFDTIARYSDKTHGEISEIDVSNPFRILVFYKDFNLIVFLDNQLATLRDPVQLDDLGFYSVDAVCTSATGSFRLYDNQSSSVITIGKDLDIIQTGTNLYSIAGDYNAVKMRESANFVFVQLASGYIIRLDKFSNFSNNRFCGDGICFDCFNDDLYIINESSVYGLDDQNNITFYYNFEPLKIRDFKIRADKLFILSEKSLITFKIL